MTEIDLINAMKQKFNTLPEFREFVKWYLGIEKNTFTSWKGIIKFWTNFNSKFSIKENNINEGPYFKTEGAKYIFALCYLEMELRSNLLEITEEVYESKAEAKKWRNKIAKKIHSDVCDHFEADKAMIKLNELYKRMIKYGE